MFGAPTFWGIDLGGSSVKCVKIRRSQEGLEIAAADIVRLRGEPPEEVSFGRDRRLYRGLAAFRQRNRVGTEPVVVAVPARATFARQLNLVLVSGKPEEELVGFEVQQHIPFGLDAIVWDYQLFPPEKAGTRERRGLLVALKKETLNNYLLSLSSAEIRADDIQSAPLCLYNFVRYEYEPDPDQPFLILDIGATCADMVAVDGERYHVQTVSLGGNDVTRTLQGNFDLEFDQAEALKLNVGKSQHARHVLAAMLPSLRGFANELRNAITRFQSEMGRLRFRKVYLFGAAARTVGLERVVTDALECEVIAPRAFGRLKLGADVDPEQVDSALPDLAVACGAALKAAGVGKSRLSLISAPAVRLKQASRAKPMAVAAVLLLALLCASSIVFNKIRAQMITRATTGRGMDRGLSDIVVPSYDRWRKWRKLTAARQAEDTLDSYRALGTPRRHWLAALGDVARIVPPANSSPSGRRATDEKKLWLVRLDLQPGSRDRRRLQGVLEGGVLMRYKRGGRQKDRLATQDFIKTTVELPLRQSPWFENVRITAQDEKSSLDWKAKGKDVYVLFRCQFDVVLREPE